MAKHVDSTIDQYVAGESKFLAEVEKTDINVLSVDADFFGERINSWNDVWAEKSSALSLLRDAAN